MLWATIRLTADVSSEAMGLEGSGFTYSKYYQSIILYSAKPHFKN